MSGDQKIRVGSRKSELALIQTRHVISLLKKMHPEKDFEIVTMSTLGDKVLDIPLPKIGEKALFTKELETALCVGDVDFVVHSLKDLPTTLPPGMAIGAVLSREDPRDALVLQVDHKPCSLETLPEGSTIGTSSLRRTAQLAKKHPHLKVENIRGNLNTRLKKLDELGKYQGLILAAAGLLRMGWNSRITKILDCDTLMYAVGQGALAVECRESDEKTLDMLKPIHDVETSFRVLAERSFLKTLGGGCSAPVAVSTKLKKSADNTFKLHLKGAVWSLDGSEEIMDADQCEVEVVDWRRCVDCPYRGDTFCDIENLRNSNGCPLSPRKEIPSKRPRLNESDVPAELLRDDPHEQCPIQLPVGADFMGKCPYLESSNLVAIHGQTSANGNIEGLDISNWKQCPFLKTAQARRSQEVVASEGGVNKNENDSSVSCPYSEESKTFCGLVAHENATKVGLEEALNLGKKLAERLMAKGASKVMAKAQATIHSSITSTSAVVVS